jgi:hypothetical protein
MWPIWRLFRRHLLAKPVIQKRLAEICLASFARWSAGRRRCLCKRGRSQRHRGNQKKDLHEAPPGAPYHKVSPTGTPACNANANAIHYFHAPGLGDFICIYQLETLATPTTPNSNRHAILFHELTGLGVRINKFAFRKPKRTNCVALTKQDYPILLLSLQRADRAKRGSDSTLGLAHYVTARSDVRSRADATKLRLKILYSASDDLFVGLTAPVIGVTWDGSADQCTNHGDSYPIVFHCLLPVLIYLR